ncbi:T9SS type A sorting domain-containing protein [Acidiluteibacter ferrifornacis]|uniref:T9SS type A sorting domain-containing protein n=1 Tax=Acidiluteibacter ferrifornacis TaxID=2692424 RepID=A0A6N9NIQ9_9FLAO|nr:T9SS type A sorting domain-containing protein [Acidiluteibacter ferrifornacis]NBG65090.1 T9SS type A sorting domain-containing protein [Acidiluteibacter ferrifornacis]
MKKLLLSIAFLQLFAAVSAQNLLEKTNLTFYEHHSPAIAGSSGANGSQSGYDFVNHTYFNSFNTANFGKYLNGEESNIDMVEHNGPYGNRSKFGFTSAVSSIWFGDIKGNGTSLWVKASNNFNYNTATTVLELETEYNAGTPSANIDTVLENGIYISKIRNSNLFVAIKCYNVTNKTPGNNNIYFNFDYKYGSLSVSIKELTKDQIAIFPNPSSDYISIVNNAISDVQSIAIYSLNGQALLHQTLKNKNERIAISNLPNSAYILVLVDKNGARYTKKWVKN